MEDFKKKEDEEIKKFELLLEMQKMTFEFHADSDNTVDNKLGIFLALVFALIIGVLSSSNLPSCGIKQRELIVGLILMLISAFVFAFAMHTKSYTDPFIGVSKLKRNLSYKETILQLISDCRFATNTNELILIKKVYLYKFGILILCLGIICIILSIMNDIFIII